jgi:hypothetical protein
MPLEQLAAKEVARAVNAIAQSPTGEIGAYIADKVKLLRYKSLIKIVKRAEEVAKAEGMELKMPPLKFFVPFCEHASLEEYEDEANPTPSVLQDMWAKLLASASRDYNSTHQVFRRILSEIGPNEAHYLRRLVEDARVEYPWRGNSLHHEDSTYFPESFVNRFAYETRGHSDPEIAEYIIKAFETPGVSLEYVSTGIGHPWETSQETEYISRGPSSEFSKVGDSESLLVSLGVIERFHFDYSYFDGDRFLIEGVHLTNLGADFVTECTDLKFSRTVEVSCDTDPRTGKIIFASRSQRSSTT